MNNLKRLGDTKILTGAVFSTAYVVVIILWTGVYVRPRAHQCCIFSGLAVKSLARFCSELVVCSWTAQLNGHMMSTKWVLYVWLTAEGQLDSVSVHLVCFFYFFFLFLSFFISLFFLSPSLYCTLSCLLAPSLLFTTCLAHSSSARWNNTPSHTKNLLSWQLERACPPYCSNCLYSIWPNVRV